MAIDETGHRSKITHVDNDLTGPVAPGFKRCNPTTIDHYVDVVSVTAADAVENSRRPDNEPSRWFVDGR